MTFSEGTKVGAYEIIGPLGKGGMGEVYRARDLRLKRDVAIKVLPEEFLRDPGRVARFQREAELVASLNHPHIAAIYQLEETGESKVIVLELVEGETLADVIARGAIPIDDALAIGRQIAAALEAAHEKGVIHRDLKPANIKLTGDGTVKVLDFGLAKMTQSEQLASNLSHSPTLMSASIPGTIMGTAAYMSPEQAKGKDVDRRSDIWAFGCVLFEMLTALPAFDGETTGEILAGILKGEPDWQRLPADTPQNIRLLIRRCLQKDRKERLQDIGDARLEIDYAKHVPSEQPNAIRATTRRKERLIWSSALAVITLLSVLAIVRANRPADLAPEMRFDITTPSASDAVSFAISPDGQKIIFEANSGGSRLWLRSIGSTIARPLPGTDGAAFPFWSPDNRAVGFFAERQLKRIDIDSGLVKVLAAAPTGFGGTWNRDGTILFAPSAQVRPIYRIPALGGEPVAVTKVDPAKQTSHLLPHFLPDGRHFLYYVLGQAPGVYLGDIDGPETRLLIESDQAAVYSPSGHLLFLRHGTLFAEKFDSRSLMTVGDPFAIVEQQILAFGFGRAAIASSAAGPILYRADPGLDPQFTWFDRTGKRIQTVGNPDKASDSDAALSPDGRLLAASRSVNGNTDLWLIEVGRGILRRFTVGPENEQRPLWSSDGTQIVFAISAKGIYRKSVSGTGTEELLLARTGGTQSPLDWSPNGRFILFRYTSTPQTGIDLWALPLTGDRKPFPVIQTNFSDDNGQFSPDGNWIAYQSNESGRYEIYIQPFADPSGKTQISINGGVQPRWRHDGKELFYIGPDNRLMAAPIQFAPKNQAVEAGTPVSLFETHLNTPQDSRQAYIVSPDGQRFLMKSYPGNATSPITVILNWKPKP